MNFGQALEAVKDGKLATFQGWKKQSQFIFMRPADKLHVRFVANVIKSLPQSVKDYYRQDCVDGDGAPLDLEKDDVVKFTAYLCMKSTDGTIINGWTPSQSEMLLEDWELFEL